MIFWRLGKRWILITLGFAFFASLVLAQWAAYAKPVAAFYLLPTRGWELLIGAFTAFYLSRDNPKEFGKTGSEFAGWLGIALILYAILGYSKTTPFPSLYALVPTIGCVLIIIFATKKTFVGKLIGNKVFVFIGLISYSAYLWHQPLFAFARYKSLMEEPSSIVFLMLSLLSMILAYVSWRFVEKPFRSGEILNKKNFSTYWKVVIFFSPIIVGLLLLFFESHTYFSLKNPNLIPSTFLTQKWDGKDCDDFHIIEGDSSCSVITYGIPTTKIIVWGDSHALALKKFKPIFQNTELTIIGHTGCPPLINIVGFDGLGTNTTNCSSPQTLIHYLDWINKKKPDKVLLIGRWSFYIEGFGSLRNHRRYKKEVVSDEKIINEKLARIKTLRDGFLLTIDSIMAMKVFIINQPMDFHEIGVHSMYERISIPKVELSSYNSSRFAFFNNLGYKDIVDIASLFCNEQECYSRRDGMLIYEDDNHLSSYGAKLVWDKLGQVISPP
jgi:hypothetical protein